MEYNETELKEIASITDLTIVRNMAVVSRKQLLMIGYTDYAIRKMKPFRVLKTKRLGIVSTKYFYKNPLVGYLFSSELVE